MSKFAATSAVLTVATATIMAFYAPLAYLWIAGTAASLVITVGTFAIICTMDFFTYVLVGGKIVELAFIAIAAILTALVDASRK